MDKKSRASYGKTVGLAAGGAILIAALGVTLSFVFRSPTLVMLVAIVFAAPFIAVALGGVIVMRRDDDIASGRSDFFSTANRTRSEVALGPNYASGAPWTPRLFRAIVRHGRPVVGERVRIRSFEEIAQTLDATGCVDGLPFMPEMVRFCGQTARVFRSVDKIYDYGGAKNLRRMKDAVLLTLLRCDGSAHDGCQARCYLIWKTAWLERLDAQHTASDLGWFGRRLTDPANGSTATEVIAGLRKTDVRGRYMCQYTRLVAATSPMSARDPRQDLRPLLEGNVAPMAFTVALLTRLFNRVQRARGGAGYPFLHPGPAVHDAEFHSGHPRELVRVRSPESIATTLDRRGRNRGLWFDLEMLKHCGQLKRVERSVDRIIDDTSGKMLQMKATCLVLEDVQASGEFLRFCPQNELIFWREAWLARDQGPPHDAAIH